MGPKDQEVGSQLTVGVTGFHSKQSYSNFKCSFLISHSKMTDYSIFNFKPLVFKEHF